VKKRERLTIAKIHWDKPKQPFSRVMRAYNVKNEAGRSSVIVQCNRRVAILASAIAVLLVGAGTGRSAESNAQGSVYFDAGAVGVTPGGFDAVSSLPSQDYAPLRSWSPDLSQPIEFTNLGPWSGYSSWKNDTDSSSFARVRVKSD
jgi:hypothetical protein